MVAMFMTSVACMSSPNNLSYMIAFNDAILCCLLSSVMTWHGACFQGNGNLHYRPNFNPGEINKVFYHCSKEHLKISRIAKFGGEML